MDPRIQIVSIVASLALLVGVLELVRRRRFLERYALLWLLSALVLLGLAIWRDLLATIAGWIGVAYPPNALFVIAGGFILLLLLHFSLAVSRLADQSKLLAQRLALLEERLHQSERAAATSPPRRVGADGDGADEQVAREADRDPVASTLPD
jgi:hypothetical protein